MKNLLFIAALVPALSVMSVQAQQKPRRLSTDARIEKVVYSSDNVVPIYGRPFIDTQILFGPDEIIQNVQNGDLAAWTQAVNKGMPHMMFVKPTVYKSNTNMIVITNKHSYYFVLHALPKNSKRVSTYAVHFIYPHSQDQKNSELQTAYKALTKKQEDAAIQAKNKKDLLHWNYSFWGDKTLIPVHMYDNGKQTFLQLQPNQPMPAVFAVTSKSGDEETVNYRRKGNMLVIDQVAPEFVLRQGKNHVAALFNNTQVNSLTKKVTYPKGPSHE